MAEREIARKVDVAWAINTKKDFCKVGDKIIPFDIVCDLSKAITYSPNVNANSAGALTVTHRIVGVVGNAGKGIESGVSQLAGEVVLTRGSSTVFINGKAGVRDGDRCQMNCAPAGKSNVEGRIYTSPIMAYRARQDDPVPTDGSAAMGPEAPLHEPDPVLKNEYKSQIPGGYSDHIADLQSRLRAADAGGTLDQATKKSFMDEINAELQIANERRNQLPNVFDLHMSAADQAAQRTLDADMALLLKDRETLDEMYFDATPAGKVKAVIEVAMLARAIQTLPKHLGNLGKWLRSKARRAPKVEPPPPPRDGLSVKKVDLEELEKRRQRLGWDPATKKFRPTEADTALRVEQKQGITLDRYEPSSPGAKGDWYDTATGKVYDGCSPSSTQYFDRQIATGQYKSSLLGHLEHPTVDFVVVDTTGLNLTAAQQATFESIFKGLTPEQAARIVRLP